MSETIVITGAGGFLGSHLAEYYLSNNYSVIAIDNFCTGLKSNRLYLENKFRSKVMFYEFDVCGSWNEIEQAAPLAWNTQLKYVFHFASPASPPHYQRLGLETMWTNSTGLARCIEFADKRNARVIFASTSEVYGDPSISPQPEAYWGNVNSYGERSCYDESKRFGESLIYTHNKRFGTKHGLVRIFNTYGPRMNPNDGRVVLNFILQALKNEDITIYGDGLQTRSFCYVDDLIKAISLYAGSNLVTPVNIGNNREFTMIELADIVKKQLNSNSKIIHKPLPSDDPKQRRPDLTKANQLLDYSPKISLEDGIIKTSNWIRNLNADVS